MNPFSIDHYRQVLRDLQSGVAERRRTEQELAEFESSEDGASLRKLEQTLRALTDQFHQSIAAANEKYDAERQSLDDRNQAETDAALDEYGQSVGHSGLQIDAEREQVDRKYQENCWLLASIHDDKAENSPQWQFERLASQFQQSRESLAQQWNAAEALQTQALALVEKRRQRVEPQCVVPTPSRNRDEASRRFAAATHEVPERLERLKQQVMPRLFQGLVFVPAAVLVWSALFAFIAFAIDPQWLGFSKLTGSEWLLVSCGAALGISFVALLITFAVAARQTAEAYELIAQSLTDARAHQEEWQRFAKDELQAREQDYRTRQATVVERRERSLAQFTATREQQVGELEARRRHELQQAGQRREKALQDASGRHNQRLLTAEAAHRSQTIALRTGYDRECERLTQNQKRQLAEQFLQRDELWKRCQTHWQAGVARLREASAALEVESRRWFPDWDEIASPAWKAPETLPSGLRIGDYTVNLRDIPDGLPADQRLIPAETTFRFPAVLPFPETPSLLLKARGAGRSQAVHVLQTAMLRLLAELPAGDARFTILDPVGLGENFAAFMHLADYDDLLISNRIWTETAQIEQQLANLTEHMENVFQKYLRNEFASIEEYNVRAGEVAEPYRILVVANFPANFSERAAQRLVSIATSGARCGVYTLISVDTPQPVPRGFDLSNLEVGTTVLEWQDGQFVNLAIGPQPLPLAADLPPSAPLMATLIKQAGERSKHIRRVEVPFHRIVPGEDSYWTADSRKSIDVPLGRAGATKLQHLRLGIGTSQHVLVAGKTGSGKSTLLNVIVTDLALRYSPDEVEFYLIDFKKGVEFKTYATHQLPHARVISIESDREFGVSVLERLDAVLKERGDRFRQEGVQDIAAFRDVRPEVVMPRILLIVDEFQEFFVEDDKYSQTAALLLDRLVRQGRAFGMHVLLGSQTLGGAYSLARTTIGQMAVRIALQCSEADAHLILSESNTAARLLTRPGEAIYNDANGLVEGNNPFQVAWLDDDERDDYLMRVNRLARERNRHWPEPIVFEGNLPADPSRNAALRQLVESTQTAAPHEFDADRPLSVWLGEAVSITGPAAVSLARRSGSNLLIVGQDADASLGILGNCIVALDAQLRSKADRAGAATPGLHLFAGSSGSAYEQRWAGLLAALPTSVRVTRPAESAGTIAEIATEVSRRQSESTGVSPLFLLIDDLSRFRDLRKSEDDFGFGGLDRDEPPTAGQLFANVLREGPAVDVHVVVWCDSYNNVERWLSRQSLREFEMRVAFQMSTTDSSNLIDSPAAARLGVNRALLYSDEHGTTEKFRPYGPPLSDWLLWLAARSGIATSDSLAGEVDLDRWMPS